MSESKRAEAPAGVVVEVSSRRFDVPFECPCCGAEPDAEMAVPLARMAGHAASADSARELDFPYCERCLEHLTRWEAAGLVSAAVMLSGIVASVALAIAGQLLIGALVFVAAFVIASLQVTRRRRRARAACRPSCAGPGLAVAYFGWSGNTSAFSFRSPTYTARFAEHNAALLANQRAELRRLLEGHRVARLAVPTPATAAPVPPPPDVRGWIARIEGATTRAARRHHVRLALGLLHDPADQQALVDAASRVDLAPALARLAQLRSAGRRDYVEQQMAAVRADNLPAPLQQAELALLETQLRGA